MNSLERPYGEIAERIIWHRSLLGMTQLEYANSINATRSTLNNWESGAYRLSVTGALGIHRQHGVSLDFLFGGDVEALSVCIERLLADPEQARSMGERGRALAESGYRRDLVGRSYLDLLARLALATGTN
mgnify:CR=1 FL=1